MTEKDLRQLQKTELSILNDVVELCKKNKIRYFLSGGTLLGAVRHQGFIPWDDDIDIDMPYEDYLRFLQIAPSEFSEKYFVQTYETDDNFQRAHAKVRLNNTTLLEKDLRKYYIHQGIWIDVFPLAYINKGMDRKIKKMILSISNFCQAENYVNASKEEMQKTVGRFGMKLLNIYYRLFSEKTRKKQHRFLLKMIFVKSDHKTYITEVWAGITRLWPRSTFEGVPTKISFEGFLYNAPPDWDTYLKIPYGDYMKLPPVEEQVNHNISIVDFEKDYSEYLEYDR